MNDNARKIQVVINTLESIEIKATFENCNHMMGIYKTLAEVRDAIDEMDRNTVTLFADGEKIGEEKADGNTRTE